MCSEGHLRLRPATLDDVPVLERWDADPDVIAATTDDDTTERAFGGLEWREELGQDSDVSYHPDRGSRRQTRRCDAGLRSARRTHALLGHRGA